MDQNKTLDRQYIVSESWSQAAIISKDYKLGIMLDPTNVKKNFDYRSFGSLKNTEATGVSGDVALTTLHHTNNDAYTIVLELTKSY